METVSVPRNIFEVNMFKSYYVVWKHPPGEEKKEEYIGFKSYYVVWKPKDYDISEQICFCLNRTM